MGFEATGRKILESLGFKKLRKPSHVAEGLRYDFEAEKDGVEYTIEVKSTTEKTGGFTVPVTQLREMARQFFDNKRKALLLFVDESQISSAILDYYLFEMKSVSFGSFYCEEIK